MKLIDAIVACNTFDINGHEVYSWKSINHKSVPSGAIGFEFEFDDQDTISAQESFFDGGQEITLDQDGATTIRTFEGGEVHIQFKVVAPLTAERVQRYVESRDRFRKPGAA